MENMWLSHTQLPHLPSYTIVTKPRAQTSKVCFIFLQCLRLKRPVVLNVTAADRKKHNVCYAIL